MSERVEEDVVALLASGELRAARPQDDRLGMEATRARVEQALFGVSAPAKVGRYLLLDHQANGGMGVVHAAYDPELHRKVALKVLHPRQQWDPRAHERLIAEARALARLDHPNVVTVHDVITQHDQVVVVMEWLEGITLAAWERECRRAWRDVVATYAQAGRGLAAAHSVGVVHRDFKPSNAIIGADGRVRVLDFGLACPSTPITTPLDADGRQRQAPLLAPPLGSDLTIPTLTATGAMVGTLAYAAPEQIAGDAATPASDQFSFGVALHRALERVAPFGGVEPEAMLRSIRAGSIATGAEARLLPTWLREVIAKTLAVEPAARFPSMSALLTEFDRPRGWRKWRTPVAMAAGAAIAASAVLFLPDTSDPLAECNRNAEIDAIWNSPVRAGLDTVLSAKYSPDILAIGARVLFRIDEYRDRWVDAHRDACVARRHGQRSDTLFDRQMVCLQKRLGDLRATVTVLGQPTTSASNTIDAVARMPRLADCTDLESLAADAPPPSRPAQRTLVEIVRSHISQAMALQRAGHSAEALATASAAVAEAEPAAYPPIVAETALTQGRILLERRQLDRAIPFLHHARDAALRQHQLSIAVEAAARELYSEGMEGADATAIQRIADVFIPLSEGLVGDRLARPLLLSNLGTVYMAAENRPQATQYFQQAHAALAAIDDPDLELTVIDSNLAMVTADATQRESLARSVWDRLRSKLGDSHLATLEALENYGRLVDAPTRALPLIAQACNAYQAFHAELTRLRVRCESDRAFLAGQVGDHVEELRRYDAVAAIAAGATANDIRACSDLAVGYARWLRGDNHGAVLALQRVVEADSQSTHWWVQARAAQAELGLGLAEQSLGRLTVAAGHLSRAIAVYRRVVTLHEWTEYRHRLALAQRALAALQ
jgi:serine/threonine protein kinase/tetratricopeptide (TPR) repeat protein